MNTCACASSHRTSVAFAHGIVMDRCRVHELRTWTLNGQTTDAGTARALLKDLFVETRGKQTRTRSTSPAAAAPTVIALTVPSQGELSSDVALGAGADTALTALLRSRGLQGSWAVA